MLTLLLLTTGLAGCFTPGEPTDPAATSADAHANTTLNPWQRGLADHHPTPDHVETRSADERRANLAEPGDPRFAAFDAEVEGWMAFHEVPTGQLAIMREGELRYVNAYGPTNRDGSDPANGSTMFRLASVTKPVTAAVVDLQVQQGLYNWSDPVFCLPPMDPPANCRLPIEPHPAFPVEDERLRDVTVRHLVEHEAGWGGAHDGIMFSPGTIEVARELGVETPPPAWRLAQVLMGEELVHEPGAESRYCNLCYMTAALVAEAATGASFQALLDAYMARPLDLEGDIEVGRTLPDQRNPREPFYHCEEQDRSVFHPNETVCEPDGEWSMRVYRGNGGLIATAEAVATIYEAYPEHTFPYYEGHGCPLGMECRGHTGALPGTRTGAGIIQGETATSGFVFLFNRGAPAEACERDEAEDVLDPVPWYGCDVADLMVPLFTEVGAWAEADEVATGGTGGR